MLNLPSIKEERKSFLKEFMSSFVPREEPQEEKVNLKSKKVLVMDFGLQTEAAVRLARDFSKVYYFVPWANAFPKSALSLIGEGLEGVERVNYPYDPKFLETIDLVCFFDTFSWDISTLFRSMGKRVFAPGKAERIENDRWRTKQLMKALDLPIQPVEKITGLENLIEFLKQNKNKWVKLNTFRGDIETFKHDTYDSTSAQYFGEILNNLGAKASQVDFIIEDNIEGVEVGYDGFVVDGEYPSICMYGYEKKKIGYIGRVSKYDKLPEPLKLVNEKLKVVFKRLTPNRTFFSTEVLIDKKGTGYLTDPCVRAPMPVPSAIQEEMYTNFSEFIWNAADGKLIDLKPQAVYGAGMVITSDWATNHWTEIEIDPKVRRMVKLRTACNIDGKFYGLPGLEQVATVMGFGNTIQEAIDRMKSNLKGVKVKRDAQYNLSGIDEIANKTIPEGRKYGIKF